MKNIKGFYSFINEGIRIMPKGLADGFAYPTEDDKKKYKLMGNEIICKVPNGLIVYNNKEGGIDVYFKQGIILKEAKKFVTDKIEDAVKYANELKETHMESAGD
jgi:hypothetical protein